MGPDDDFGLSEWTSLHMGSTGAWNWRFIWPDVPEYDSCLERNLWHQMPDGYHVPEKIESQMRAFVLVPYCRDAGREFEASCFCSQVPAS